MKRKIITSLIEWKNQPQPKPLVLEGARQVGKTYILQSFGEEFFDEVLHIDMQTPPAEIAAIFDQTLDPKEIIQQLELHYNTKISPERTLIFFDEVQNAPKVLTSLKYFAEEAPSYHIAVAGSLLGVYLKSSVGAPFPVGKVDTLCLQPMDFEEFLWATGQQAQVDFVKTHCSSANADSTLRRALLEYMIVGGMPEAVQSWVDTHDITKVEQIQERILGAYRHDFSKYTNHSPAVRLTQVFDTLPQQFAKNNDKFVYGIIREGARGREYELAVEWLANSGIVRRVRRAEKGDRIPLKAYVDQNSFKLYFLDIGLFRQLADIPPSVILSKDSIFDEYNGFFAEQFVLQQLSSSHELFYWTGKTAEVDFLMQDNPRARIVPIEVKSGENVKAKSLRVFREKYHPALSVRCSLLPYQYADGLLNLPLYKIFAFDDCLAEI